MEGTIEDSEKERVISWKALHASEGIYIYPIWMIDRETLKSSNQGNDVIILDLFLETKRLIFEYLNWKIWKDQGPMTISEFKWLLKVNV